MVSKSEAEGQESDWYQYEQDQDCDGDEGNLFQNVECEATRLTGAVRKEKVKEERETGRKE